MAERCYSDGGGDLGLCGSSVQLFANLVYAVFSRARLVIGVVGTLRFICQAWTYRPTYSFTVRRHGFDHHII